MSQARLSATTREIPADARRPIIVAAVLLVAAAAVQLVLALLASWGRWADAGGAIGVVLLTCVGPAGAAAWGLRRYQPWSRRLALGLAVLWLVGGLVLLGWQLVLSQPHLQRLGYPSPSPFGFRFAVVAVSTPLVIMGLLTRRAVRAAFSTVAA